MVTIYDIARTAGKSHSTVSRALRSNPRISAEVRREICRIAAELGYRPDRSARMLKSGANVIGQEARLAFTVRPPWFRTKLAWAIYVSTAIGLVGFLMRRFGFPTAPVIVGMILGPLAEEQMRRSLSISQGDWKIFVTHGISAVLLGITLVVLLAPIVARRLKRRAAAA